MNIPNLLTLLRGAMIPIFYIIFFSNITNNFLWATVIFIIASLTDWLDGFLARRWNLVTNFGKIMDPLADKLLVMTALICLLAVFRIPPWAVIIILAREMAITGLRIIVASEGVVVAADILGKLKTVFQMLAIILLLLNNFIGIYVLYVAIFFTILSGIDYVKKMNRVVKWF